jgi:hypothetical protein
MMERSLSQEREYWDEQIGAAMRRVQYAKELAEEYHKLATRIALVDPISPSAGAAQRSVLDFCDIQKAKTLQQVERIQQEVDRLKAARP